VILDLEKHGKISYDAKRDQWQVNYDLIILSLPCDTVGL
jgi:hypothetical protein